MDDCEEFSSVISSLHVQRIVDKYSHKSDLNEIAEMEKKLLSSKKRIYQLQENCKNFEKEKKFLKTSTDANKLALKSMKTNIKLLNKSYNDMILKTRCIKQKKEELENVYKKKLAKVAEALQRCPLLQKSIQLENNIKIKQVEIKVGTQEIKDITEAYQRREEISWMKERACIIQLAEIVGIQKQKMKTLQEIKDETVRLKREIIQEKTSMLKRQRSEPTIAPLEVFLVPEPPKQTLLELTPLLDMIPTEDVSEYSQQAHNNFLNISLELEMMEPPAKIAKRNHILKLDVSSKQVDASTPVLDNTEKITKSVRFFNDASDNTKIKNTNNNCSEESKQILVLNEVFLTKADAAEIVKDVKIDEMKIVEHIGLRESSPLKKETSSELQVDKVTNKEEKQMSPNKVSNPSASLLVPPTQFQDDDKTVNKEPISTEFTPTGQTSEALVDTQMSFTIDDSCLSLNLNETTHTEVAQDQNITTFSQMKENIVQKYPMFSSPEFVYSKKDANIPVTSKFFTKKVDNLPKSFEEKMVIDESHTMVTKDNSIAKNNEQPQTFAQQTLMIASTLQSENIRRLARVNPIECDVNSTAVISTSSRRRALLKSLKRGVTLQPYRSLNIAPSNNEAQDNIKEVTSLNMTAASELDETEYDFSSIIDTPSMLLSPRPDEPPVDTPATSGSALFGVKKQALDLVRAAGSEEEKGGANQNSAFNFNFQSEKKKTGFFSLFG